MKHWTRLIPFLGVALVTSSLAQAPFTGITEGDIVNTPGYSWGCAWGDFDGDGDLELFVTIYGAPNALSVNQGAGVFARVAEGPFETDADASVGCSWARLLRKRCTPKGALGATATTMGISI